MAAGLERGRILYAFLSALERYIAFAESSDLKLHVSFGSLLVQLISSRPSVYAEALDAYAELRGLVTRVLYDVFFRYTEENANMSDSDQKRESCFVVIYLFETPGRIEARVKLPLALLQSVSVLLSIWRDETIRGGAETSAAINNLADALLRKECDRCQECCQGLCSARYEIGGKAAVAVESVRKNFVMILCLHFQSP
jgi:hypothetical protein